MKAACFLILAVAAGPGAGARLGLMHPNARYLWQPRAAAAAGPGFPAGGWTRQYAAWALASRRRWWAFGLLPFLLVLGAVETETEASLPSDTYTLF